MLHSLVQTTLPSPCQFTYFRFNLQSLHSINLLPKTLFPDFGREAKNSFKTFIIFHKRFNKSRSNRLNSSIIAHASLIEAPILWAGRLCIFYALLRVGLAGSQSNPLVSGCVLHLCFFISRLLNVFIGKSCVCDCFSSPDLEFSDGESISDLGFSKWLEVVRGKPVDEAVDKRKLVSKWHPTTKGTLRRNYRVPSKSEGRRLLKAIASLLSDDDHFIDATSHKGCQIRRESAHGESVCCNNVRALFDELPTPHLIVEITPFPAGPLNQKDYTKAEKLERVLRSGPSV
ncbi:uncharacterized protein LOC111467324 isoform X1 [Cucurbita maxima]|uniref:Uncharacterized protein LOC111467324 isoform X1 n=1 Tax=Cucurbita maxima TaxID=3661 RepID=A0A6J1HS64_CUCMA|nr:uncharacterized protein LOC111467324 isoform X1 [Cucurbita maxima]